MRYITYLAALAVLLTGCFGGFGASGPGAGKPQQPDDLFTGEPTEVVVTVVSPGAAVTPVQAFSLMAAEVGPEQHEQQVLIIGTPIRNEAGHAYTTKFTTMYVDPTETLVSRAFNDVPADRGLDFTAIRYADGLVVEFGRASDIEAPAGMTTFVDVPMLEPGYDIEIANPIPSGAKVLDYVAITAHNPDDNEVPMLYGAVLLGLEEWTQEHGNGVDGLWAVNGTGEGWITELAATSKVYEEIFFAKVIEPTPLYYQVRLCVGRGFLPQEHQELVRCTYVPDVEAGERLPHVMLVPAN